MDLVSHRDGITLNFVLTYIDFLKKKPLEQDEESNYCLISTFFPRLRDQTIGNLHAVICTKKEE